MGARCWLSVNMVAIKLILNATAKLEYRFFQGLSLGKKFLGNLIYLIILKLILYFAASNISGATLPRQLRLTGVTSAAHTSNDSGDI